MSDSVNLAVRERRSLAVPGGTLGVLMALTANPRSCNQAATRRASSFDPIIRGTMCELLGPQSSCMDASLFRKSAAIRDRRLRSASMEAASLRAAFICPAKYGGIAVLKIKLRA